jgi:protein-S-isoprenylcysteine O-methyltransferase Ste14
MSPRLIISILWVAFLVVWLFAAILYHHRGVHRSWSRVAVVRLVAAGLFVVILHFLAKNGLPPATQSVSMEWAGVAVATLGIALAFWARAALAGSWGMPASQADQPSLVTSGPYHWIRHPIYTGVLLGLIGTAMAISPLLFIPFLVFLVYFIYAAVQEERYLSSKLGRPYEEYRARTKMLLPYIF